jgi:hypothetical protein
MQAGASCISLGTFFGRCFFGTVAGAFHELAHGLTVPLDWWASPDKAAGPSASKMVRRGSIVRSVLKKCNLNSRQSPNPFR